MLCHSSPYFLFAPVWMRGEAPADLWVWGLVDPM